VTEPRPLIVVVTTGGTIGSRRDPRTGAVSAVASAEELLALVPGAKEIALIQAQRRRIGKFTG